MKESVTKFDLEAAFKALDEIDIPVTEKGIRANKPALTEIFSRKTKFESLMEEYYDISNMSELDDAKTAREAEVAQAKLARIEKIVDLDAESPEDLLPSYVGKFIIQCPQCMTLFYKDKEDVEASEEDPETVNINEVCQHCGNDSGYMLIGKVGEATPEEQDEAQGVQEVDVDSTEDVTDEENQDENAEDLDDIDLTIEDDEEGLEELDLTIDEEPDEEDKKEESFLVHEGNPLVEELQEDADLEVSEAEFEKLTKSPEFQKPITPSEIDAMLKSISDEPVEESLEESVKINNEVLRYAVINSDGTYAGAPCTSKEEARELAAQADGRIVVELKEVTENLEEGIFDKLKDKFSNAIDKITGKLKSREAKADWILENAKEDYGKVKANAEGELIPDEENQRFRTFVVIGYTNKYNNGRPITMAPSFNNTDLIVGKNGVQEKDNYKNAEDIAKGWSMVQGNGPAFIYLAKDRDDDNAVFLCQFFKGELKNDQLEKYFNVVKDHLKGAELMARGGMTNSEEETTAEEPAGSDDQAEVSSENPESATNESLRTFIESVEELQESTLESLITDSLVNYYGNVSGFDLKGCNYLNEQFTIDGTIQFTSGNTRATTYTFTEALLEKDGKVVLQGIN